MKELGFTKVAIPWAGISGLKSKPSFWDKIRSGGSKVIDEGPAFVKKLREAAEGIAGPLGIKLPPQTHTKPVEKITKAVKKRGFGTGLAIGAGGAVVGGMTMNALFGEKNRNSPYYPY